MPYRTINTQSVITTIERLHRRIAERFPSRGLSQVCLELLEVATKNQTRLAALRRPYLWVKIATGAMLAGLAVGLGLVVAQVKLPNLMAVVRPDADGAEVLQLFSGFEAAVNIVVLFGAAVFFLLRHEERAKRRMALSDLYELRSLAHVIDMHQLTKDPTVILSEAQRTASSKRDQMSAFELTRYLDYCSEMLSLVAKCAALYAQDSRDPIVIESVTDLEAMTTNLSRKIWQKISLVNDIEARGDAAG